MKSFIFGKENIEQGLEDISRILSVNKKEESTGSLSNISFYDKPFNNKIEVGEYITGKGMQVDNILVNHKYEDNLYNCNDYYDIKPTNDEEYIGLGFSRSDSFDSRDLFSLK
jgi:hypothetical protein